MALFLWFAAFTAGVALLVVSADWFVSSAEKIGLYFELPSFIIGVVIVGFGTSIPELASSIASVLQNQSEMVVANAMGSNITNIFLVLGISALFTPCYTINHDIFEADVPFLMGSALLISLMTHDLHFTTMEALLCLGGLGLYLFYSIHSGSIAKQLTDVKKNKPGFFAWIILLLSPLLITTGARLTVEGVIHISRILNIATDIIALTAIALGTSLPEVMVSIQAARRGNGEMAVGNVVGSNIFNTFAVMGISAFLGDLKIPGDYTLTVLPFFLGSTVMGIFIIQDKRVFRFEGILLLLFYIFFLGNSYGFF